jgi:TRAP-type transport system periplasmic protein
MKNRFARAGLIAAALLAGAAPAQAPKFTLKFATLAPEGSAWMVKFEQIRKEVLEATGGRVALKAYPGGVLGDERDVLFKMKAGQLDGGGLVAFGMGRVCPESGALSSPMLFENYAEADAVKEKMLPYLEQKCQANGYVALGWTEVGFAYMFSTKPVRSLADLRDAKPWSLPEDAFLRELFGAGRINSILVPMTDVLTALQTGLLETIYAPPLACVALQWFTRVKYRNTTPLIYTTGGMFVTAKAWERIPADLQPKISEICHRRTQELSMEVRKSNEEALEVMARNGVQTVDSTPAQIAEFRTISDQAVAKLLGTELPAESVKLADKYLAEYRAAHPAGGHAP